MKKLVIFILLTLSVFVQAQTRPDFIFSEVSRFVQSAIDCSENIHAAYTYKVNQDTVWLYYQKYDSMGYTIGGPIQIPEAGPDPLGDFNLAVWDSIVIVSWREVFINPNSVINAKILINSEYGAYSQVNDLYMDTERFSPQPLFMGDSLIAISWMNIGSPFEGFRASTFDTSFNFEKLDMELTQEQGFYLNISGGKFFFQEKQNRFLVIWSDDRDGYWRVYGRFLDTRGNLLQEEFIISDTLKADRIISIGADVNSDGDFAVSWSSEKEEVWHPFWCYISKNLNNLGEIVSLSIDSGDVSFVSNTDISMSDSGDIIVVWEQINSNDPIKIHGQRYREYSIPFGGPFKISTENSDYMEIIPNVTLINNRIFTHWINAGVNSMANFLDFNDPYLNIDVNEENISQSFKLLQNYPNPFNPSTTIEYRLSISAHISLAIYNALGQKVRDLYRGSRTVGIYRIHWDGRDNQGTALSSGIYFYRLQWGTETQTRKMLLLR